MKRVKNDLMILNGIEEEIIILKAAIELVDSMVNYEIMSVSGTDPNSGITFKSFIQQKLFNINLGDFLSCTDRDGPIERTSYLGGLRKIAETPHFNESDSIFNLKIAANEFRDWLETEVENDVYLTSINLDTRLKIKRLDYLKMTGDI